MWSFDQVRQVLLDAVRDGVCPAVVGEVGNLGGPRWFGAAGSLTGEAAAPAAALETVFDLASLTKVLATTSLAIALVEERRLDLDEPVGRWIPRWRGGGRDEVAVADLLSHAAGLPAVSPLHEALAGREAFEQAICGERLEYRPGAASVYSDLGFILLGFLLSDVGGAPLDVQFERRAAEMVRRATERGRPAPGGQGLELRYQPPPEWLERLAPTRFDASLGRARRGEVDDQNAAALGGVAGHAGLFGTAPAVGWLAREILGARLGAPGFDTFGRMETLERFTSPVAVAGSSRGLGWDTMRPSSSCGTRMSAQAFGHTGFTGTSLWIDPAAEVYAVLLTNRVHPVARSDDAITALRRAFHDAVMDEVRTSNP